MPLNTPDRLKHPKDQLRLALASEAAKIIIEEGVRDFHRAKLKASERLGNSWQRVVA